MQETFVHLYPEQFSTIERKLVEADGLSASTFRFESDVCAVRLKNDQGELVLLPFQGQQIWSAEFGGRQLGMTSFCTQPRATRVYLETYGGFLLHCGVTAMGVPSAQDTHPLHGVLPNASYQQAWLILGEDEGGEYILWLLMWRPVQAEATAQGELGDHARRSLIRKAYMYLVLFASVIGGMAIAVALVYNLLRVLLTGHGGTDFANNILNLVQLLFLFGMVLIYHLRVLRADGASTADSLADRQKEYPLLIVDSGNGFVEAVKTALAKFVHNAPLMVTDASTKPDGEFSALVLSGSLALDAPEWIRSFSGSRIIVQEDRRGLVWADDPLQAAQAIQLLAEGQEEAPGDDI